MQKNRVTRGHPLSPQDEPVDLAVPTQIGHVSVDYAIVEMYRLQEQKLWGILFGPRVPHNLRLVKGTFLDGNSLTKVELCLRVFGRNGVRMCWLLLNSLAGKYFQAMAADGMRELKSRERFMQKNAELQGEFGRFFASYHHLCPACDGCCFSAPIPYWQLDMILYGIPDGPGGEMILPPFFWS